MAPGKHGSAWTRHLRRFFRPFLSAEDKKRLAALIGRLEQRTTAKIHVHLVGKAGPDIAAEARQEAEKRGGVVLLISHLDHRFSIWGGEDVHSKAGQELWDRAAKTLVAHFEERRYPEGVEACVRELGETLARHFPRA